MKFWSKIFLFVFFLGILFSYIYIDFQFCTIKYSFRKNDNIHTFIFSKNQFENLSWIEKGKEFYLNKILYDVDTIINKGDKILVKAILDENEINFKKLLNKKEKVLKNLYKIFSFIFYFDDLKTFVFNPSYIHIKKFYNIIIFEPFLETLSPPPRG